MVKVVEWSQKADRELARMLSYLQDEVSEQAAERLLAAVNKRIEQLKKHPEIGRRVQSKQTVRYFARNQTPSNVLSPRRDNTLHFKLLRYPPKP
jgi:plasmid stabilization system protein ParE